MQSKKWVTILSVAIFSVFGFNNASAKDGRREAVPVVENNSEEIEFIEYSVPRFKPEQTVPVVENNSAELQDNAIILDSEKITILFVAENSLLLAGADVKKITPGKILISSEGDGFLRKVTSVKKTKKGLLVQTTQGGLAEAFKSLQITIN